jgi:hypothetical protein
MPSGRGKNHNQPKAHSAIQLFSFLATEGVLATCGRTAALFLLLASSLAKFWGLL